MKKSSIAGAVVVGMVLAVLGSTSGAQAAPHQALKAKKSFTVTAKASTTELVLGKRVAITGTVRPLTAAAGEQVVVQKRYDKKKPWAKAGVTKVGAKGGFKFVDKVTTMKPRWYRVVKPKSTRRSAGASKAVQVTIFQWHDLADLDSRRSVHTYATSKVEINGTSYPDSLMGWSYYASGSMDYNLGRSCLTLVSRYGVTDDSDETSTGTLAVVADGDTLYSRSFTLTQSAKETLSIRNRFRVGYEWTSANTEPPADGEADGSGAVVTMASPQVLCSF